MNTAGFVMTTSINSDNYFCSTLINNSDVLLEHFVFCFSVLAPVKAIENCSLFNSEGGYSELSHPEEFVLKPGEDWSFQYAYEESRHKPMNHRWSPQGCFLKKNNGDLVNLDRKSTRLNSSH